VVIESPSQHLQVQHIIPRATEDGQGGVILGAVQEAQPECRRHMGGHSLQTKVAVRVLAAVVIGPDLDAPHVQTKHEATVAVWALGRLHVGPVVAAAGQLSDPEIVAVLGRGCRGRLLAHVPAMHRIMATVRATPNSGQHETGTG